MLQAKDRRIWPGAPKPAPGDDRDAALREQQFGKFAILAATQTCHRLAHIGERIERPGTRQAGHAGQAVQRLRR